MRLGGLGNEAAAASSITISQIGRCSDTSVQSLCRLSYGRLSGHTYND